MDAASASSSSKVIVQCTDPSNLYESFGFRLLKHLPLRNLHWKSPSRPLRSIPSLNVSLSRNETSQNGVPSTARRHQIPGLRETPYVKLYLLRCDDKENYKETARKEIKQWIKDNTLAKESKSSLKNQEHHDAYEWIIVHVVLPDTPAAHQPKSSKHLSLDNTDSTDSVNSKSKWTGKGTSTIYDKLRADFSSSKTDLTHVAQVRILDQAKPAGALPYTEQEDLWQDLADTLKAAILKSFDTRVAQYEDDIKEREAQRTLPGWNFCTFFILKEGLARGFENVGLLDDALAVYSELELGMDMLVMEQQAQDEVGVGGGLLPFSKDLKTVIRKALDEKDQLPTANSEIRFQTFTDVLASDPDQHPFDIERRNYRDLILSNDVSPLDLRTYMFARKMEILFRRARIAIPGHTSIDLNIVSDFVELALRFINIASKGYRSDLQAAFGGRLSGEERAMQKVVIGNLVASWTWSAVMQVLRYSLPAVESDFSRLDGKLDLAAEKFLISRTPPIEEIVRSNASSLYPNLVPQPLNRTSSSPNVSSVDLMRRQKSASAPGLDRLRSWIGRAVLLLRKVLETMPATTAWGEELLGIDVPGFKFGHPGPRHLSSSLDLSALANGCHEESDPADLSRSLKPSVLQYAVLNQAKFHGLYQLLSKVAYNLSSKAADGHTARQILIDLALLEYSLDNKRPAAQYLGHFVKLDEDYTSDIVSPFAISLYAECLKGLQEPNKLAHCLVLCLSGGSPVNEVDSIVQQRCNELLSIAEDVDAMDLNLEALFTINALDGIISLWPDRDGFYMSVRLSSHNGAILDFEGTINLILVPAEGQMLPTLILSWAGRVEVDTVASVFDLASTASVSGWYLVDRLEIGVGNFNFTHRYRQVTNDADTPRLFGQSSKTTDIPVLIFPRADALGLKLSPATTIRLGETRKLSFSIHSKASNVAQCTIKLRPGTAGLRLQMYNAMVSESTSTALINITHEQDGYSLQLSDLSANEGATVVVPYTIEDVLESVIFVHCEITYEVDGQRFSKYELSQTDTGLPVSVNVQDMHRTGSTFSRFLVGPSMKVPIMLVECTTRDEEHVTVESTQAFDEAMVVYANEPATWTAKLTRIAQSLSDKSSFTLNVRYQCLDEVILASLREDIVSSVPKEHKQIAEMLASHLLDTVKEKWTEHDLEFAGLTKQMERWSMAEIDWQSVLCGLDQKTKIAVVDWLKEWHGLTEAISLKPKLAPIRELLLKVDLGRQPRIYTATLRMRISPKIATIGQPLVCDLTLEDSQIGEQTENEVYSYEVFASPESWLIGGRKKGNFQSHSRLHQDQLVLFPQKLGRLLLPQIDLRCRRMPKGGSEEWVDVAVEVHNKSISATLLVVPHLQSTTIGLGGEHGGQVNVSGGFFLDGPSRG